MLGRMQEGKGTLKNYWFECKLVQPLWKIDYYKGTCTPMITIAKLWKHLRCPITEEWIKKIWYFYTMEFHSATKENEILSLTGKWMYLENIILREDDFFAQKAKNHMFSLICRL
jgi:hypothetical protein